MNENVIYILEYKLNSKMEHFLRVEKFLLVGCFLGFFFFSSLDLVFKDECSKIKKKKNYNMRRH